VINILKKSLNTKDVNEQNKLRMQLHSILENKYKGLLKRGILQYHFVLPNNKSFLRFHKTSKYGDDLSDVRHDFVFVNKTKRNFRGFVEGKTSHSFRNIYPIFDENKKHLGAVEISFSSEYLQDNFAAIANIHTHFLVNKNIFNSKAWKRDDLVVKYMESVEDENYMISMPKTHTQNEYIDLVTQKLKGIEEKVKQNIIIGKPFALYSMNQHEYVDVISFLPITNPLENEVLAWIVSYEKNDFINFTINNNNYIRSILFFILAVLFYFVYKTLFKKQELEDAVELKTAELKELNENLEQKVIIEVEKSKNMEAKLFHSDKMASMGEMIGNIAHQWRQPLSAISTGATGMKVKKEYGMLTDEDFCKSCDNINKHAQYLSQTIDDFRNYIKGDRNKTIFTLKSDIDSFLHLIEGSLKKETIDIVVDVNKDITIDGYPNELVQCFINLYNNAKDAFKEKQTENKSIFISSFQNEEITTIYFKDNAGGIPKEVIAKVFEPYFSTKHKSQGTGLGLHMTYTLIVDGMKGIIEVHNRTFDYNDNVYTGAEFSITLPR
jgi:signal transduction histidine kinase